jgi:hypothetical protein
MEFTKLSNLRIEENKLSKEHNRTLERLKKVRELILELEEKQRNKKQYKLFK